MKKNTNTKTWIISCLTVGLIFLTAGCATPPDEFKQAQVFLERNDLVRAVDSYREALNQKITTEQRRDANEQIGLLTTKISDEKTEEAQTRWGQGQSTQDCNEAISFLSRFSSYDNSDGKIQAMITFYQGQKSTLASSARQYIQQAHQEATSNNWSEAVRAIDLAIQLDPSNQQAQPLRQELIHSRNSYYSNQVEQFCTEEQWKAASKTLQQFRAESPNPETKMLNRLSQQIETVKIHVVSNEAQALANQNKFLTAYRHLNDNDVSRHNKELVEKIRKDGCTYYIQTATHEKNVNVRDFHAFAAALKATQIDPQNREAAQLYQEYSRRVVESLQKELGFVRFSSPSSEPDSGNNIRIFLVGKLRSQLPYGYKIAEHEKVDVAIETEGGLDSPRIRVYFDFIIHGDVMTYNVERSETSNTITDWVDIKTTVRNPEYDRFKSLHGPDTRRWPSIPPETIESVTLQEVTYQKGETRIRGDMRVRCVFRISEENVDRENTFTLTKEENSPFQTGVPRAGIPLIEKVVFSETDLKNKLMDEMVGQVSQWLLEAIENPHLRYLQRGLTYIEHDSQTQAIEAMAKAYLYCEKIGILSSDASFSMIRQSILYDLTE